MQKLTHKIQLDFEDWGQDIKQITIDLHGKVLDVQPDKILMMADAVVQDKTFVKGMIIKLKCGEEMREFPYPVIKAQPLYE